MTTPSEKGRNSARETLTHYGVVQLPVPVEKIIKKLGISVRFSPLDDELSGMAVIKDGVSVIGVNALHHPNRQRFTMAHELGHHVMHRDLINGTIHIDKGFTLWRGKLAEQGTDSIEIEANAFASELLLPRDLISNVVGLDTLDMDDEHSMNIFAKRFKVSTMALRYRLLSLR
jgi:Zn-dependent peptidase ImmA (M78 family)